MPTHTDYMFMFRLSELNAHTHIRLVLLTVRWQTLDLFANFNRFLFVFFNGLNVEEVLIYSRIALK